MSIAYIYVLKHPQTMEVRYVGVTRFPKERARTHCRPESSVKGRWVQSLIKAGLKPRLEVIEVIDEEIWQLREQHWIRRLKAEGARLTNGDMGGLNRIRHTEELKQKISSTLAGRPNIALAKEVHCYATSGEHVAAYGSGSDAAKAVGCDRPNIVRAIKNSSKCAGFFWSYQRFDRFIPPERYVGGRYVATPSHRALLSKGGKAQLGKVVSVEARARMSESAKRRHARSRSTHLESVSITIS